MYIPEAAVDATLRFVATNSASGSQVVSTGSPRATSEIHLEGPENSVLASPPSASRSCSDSLRIEERSLPAGAWSWCRTSAWPA
jgi:O-methyltransferase involved in polyketide biosynthesis